MALTAPSFSIPNLTVAVPLAVPLYVWSAIVICVLLFFVNARSPLTAGVSPDTPDTLTVPVLGKFVAVTFVRTTAPPVCVAVTEVSSATKKNGSVSADAPVDSGLTMEKAELGKDWN